MNNTRECENLFPADIRDNDEKMIDKLTNLLQQTSNNSNKNKITECFTNIIQNSNVKNKQVSKKNIDELLKIFVNFYNNVNNKTDKNVKIILRQLIVVLLDTIINIGDNKKQLNKLRTEFNKMTADYNKFKSDILTSYKIPQTSSQSYSQSPYRQQLPYSSQQTIPSTSSLSNYFRQRQQQQQPPSSIFQRRS